MSVYTVCTYENQCVFVVVCAHECVSISFMKGCVYVCVLIGATVHTPCSVCVSPKWALTVCSLRHTHNAALCADLRNVREHRAVGEKRAAGVDGGRVRKGRGMRRGEERSGGSNTSRLQGCVGWLGCCGSDHVGPDHWQETLFRQKH